MSMVLVDKEKLKKALRDCVETGYIRGHCDTVENAFNLQCDMVSYEIVEALERENGPVSSLNPIPAEGLIEAGIAVVNKYCDLKFPDRPCGEMAGEIANLRKELSPIDEVLKREALTREIEEAGK